MRLQQYYAGGALRLPSSDREASLARRRGTTIRFVDGSSFWHVEIIGKYFYFSSQAINVIIHSLAYPPQWHITREQGRLFDPCWHCTVANWEIHSEGISSSKGLAPNVETLYSSLPLGTAESFTGWAWHCKMKSSDSIMTVQFCLLPYIHSITLLLRCNSFISTRKSRYLLSFCSTETHLKEVYYAFCDLVSFYDVCFM